MIVTMRSLLMKLLDKNQTLIEKLKQGIADIEENNLQTISVMSSFAAIGKLDDDIDGDTWTDSDKALIQEVKKMLRRIDEADEEHNSNN